MGRLVRARRRVPAVHRRWSSSTSYLQSILSQFVTLTACSPALTTVNGQAGRMPTYSNGNYLSHQGQQMQFYNQQMHTINPAFVHTTPAQFQGYRSNRTILSQAPSASPPMQGTLSPFVLHSEPSTSTSAPVAHPSFTIQTAAFTASPPPSAEQLRERLLADLRPYLQPTSFSGAGAVAHLTDLVRDFGLQDVDPQVRLEIVSKIRDNAGNHYFRAWLENPLAMEITQEWLRACVGKEDPQLLETLMPLLQVCKMQECVP